MNKKSSILFQITLFFIIIFLIINALVFIQFKIEKDNYSLIESKRYFNAIKIVEKSHFNKIDTKEINEKLTIFDMQLSSINISELLSKKPRKVNISNEIPIDIYVQDELKYIHFNPKPPFEEFDKKFPPPPHHMESPFNHKPQDILLIDNQKNEKNRYFWLIALAIIDILLIWFYFFIRKKLLPLNDLKENMIELSKGNFKISTKTNKKDEISQVASEFDNAICQLRQLRESRNLFLRNIMHELKTPITKGKLVSDLIPEDENKYILIRVFHRLEYLLSEFSHIEELTSGKIKLDKNSFRAIDILEQAFDILLLEDNTVDVFYNSDLIFDVDFELFSIALKNLIDNSLKYNTNGNPEIFIEADYIRIRNKGNKLKKRFKSTINLLIESMKISKMVLV